MEGNMIMPPVKKRKMKHILQSNFLNDFNVLELIYSGLTKGCKTAGHSNRKVDRLYIIPCPRTLEYKVFQTIFTNPPARAKVDLLEKQHAYKDCCHKICQACLNEQRIANFIHCPACVVTKEIDFSNHTQVLFDMVITRGFEIDNLSDFHNLSADFKRYLEENSNSKKKKIDYQFIVFQCTFRAKGFFECSLLEKFKIKAADMRIVIGYTEVPNENTAQPFWINKSYENTWQDIYENSKVIPKTSSNMLLLNGNHILQHEIKDLENLVFEDILLIYISNIWSS